MSGQGFLSLGGVYARCWRCRGQLVYTPHTIGPAEASCLLCGEVIYPLTVDWATELRGLFAQPESAPRIGRPRKAVAP